MLTKLVNLTNYISFTITYHEGKWGSDKTKYYFGVGSNQFDDNDINHLVERKLTTSLDICPAITHLLSIEHLKVAKDKRRRNGL